MALSSDLMGLGVNPLQAARTATGGTGPLTITPAGTSFATSTKIGCTQFLVTSTGAAGACLGLPAIGGDNGALIADDYIINNQGTATLQVFASTSVLISVNGTISSRVSMTTHTTMTLYPTTAVLATGTANWVGTLGN